MTPFFVAGLIVLYGVNAGANAMMDSEEFRNDPRKCRWTAGTCQKKRVLIGNRKPKGRAPARRA